MVATVTTQLMQGSAVQQNTALQMVADCCNCLMHYGISMESSPFSCMPLTPMKTREKSEEEQAAVALLLHELVELLLEQGFFARLAADETMTAMSNANSCEVMMTSLLLGLNTCGQLTDEFLLAPLSTVG